MAAVYSTRLFAGAITVAGTQIHLLTVPTGQRAVIRFIGGTITYVSGNVLRLYVGLGGAELIRVPPASASGDLHLDVRLVVHEGESVYGSVVSPSAVFSLHGFLLEGGGGPLTVAALPAVQSSPSVAYN